jgi:hypothetical protein
MLTRIRRLTASLAIAGLALSLALPARADRVAQTGSDPDSMPMVFVDAMLLRPLGLVTVFIGAALYVFPVAPVVALTRPMEIGKPLGPLVGVPLAFTFKDPLGHHPKRWDDNQN